MKAQIPQSAETATPADPEQTVLITSGLLRSDKSCVEVPVSKVQSYLEGKWAPPGYIVQRHKDCYERTQPTERDPTRVLNRVYVDVDGVMETDTTEEAFYEKVEQIKTTLANLFGDECAVKDSSKWRNFDDKGNRSNKLSFGINYKYVAGTRTAIAHFVRERVGPKIKKALKDIIPVLSVVKKDSKTNYNDKLIIDFSVYSNGRKMRMMTQNKPDEDRPWKLVSGEFIDTLITYVPLDDVSVLEEPQSILKMAETKESDDAEPRNEVVPPRRVEVESVAPSSTADPTEEDIQSRELLQEAISSLGQNRWDYYPDWIRIGFVMFNEGLTLEDFTEASKTSKHFQSGSPAWIRDKWKQFRKSNLNQALIWKWLSEDNLDAYMELSARRRDFWALVKNPSHAEAARFFFNLKPDSYLYNESLGWFQLQPSNIWKRYEKKHPHGLLADIFHTFKKIIKEHQATIPLTTTDDEKGKAAKAKLASLLQFLAKIGNKSFNDGVIAFLPSCYNMEDLDTKMDESRHLLAFSDKVYDLDKHEVRDIKPDDYICLNTGYPFPVKRFPEAKKELVDCLRSIFETDEEIAANKDIGPMTHYMLKTLAMTLHGQKKYESFFVWTGSGGNGKGVLAEMLSRVLGDYFHTVPSTVITKTQDRKDATNPALAKAKGKRCVMTTEPEADDKLQVGELKLWTGNDRLSARDLYTSTITFVAQFLLFLQTNNIPELNRVDGGITRRMKINQFRNKFVENPSAPNEKKINIDLKEKIIKSAAWRDEMFLLILEAYKALEKEGIKPPASVAAQTQEYMDQQNPVKEWLEANFTLGLSKTDKRFWWGSDNLLKQFNAMTGKDLDSTKFKAAMEGLGQTVKQDKHGFTATRWVMEKGDNGKWAGSWVDGTECKAGRYWQGMKKLDAPMPPTALFME